MALTDAEKARLIDCILCEEPTRTVAHLWGQKQHLTGRVCRAHANEYAKRGYMVAGDNRRVVNFGRTPPEE